MIEKVLCGVFVVEVVLYMVIVIAAVVMIIADEIKEWKGGDK